jgi:ethanolamine ammonia-lyase small subunit
MTRFEYQQREIELAKRGEDLPQSRLTDADVKAIKEACQRRADLREWIADNLSNEALARKYGVHIRTVERITQLKGWIHI